MDFVLFNTADIRQMNRIQLEYIPKIVLIQKFPRDIHYVWHKLPNHIKFDREIQVHRLCFEHYNLPSQRTHIDGPPPMIKSCCQCNENQRDAGC